MDGADCEVAVVGAAAFLGEVDQPQEPVGDLFLQVPKPAVVALVGKAGAGVSAGAAHARPGEAFHRLPVALAVEVDDRPVAGGGERVGEPQDGLGLAGSGRAGDEQVVRQPGERRGATRPRRVGRRSSPPSLYAERRLSCRRLRSRSPWARFAARRSEPRVWPGVRPILGVLRLRKRRLAVQDDQERDERRDGEHRYPDRPEVRPDDREQPPRIARRSCMRAGPTAALVARMWRCVQGQSSTAPASEVDRYRPEPQSPSRGELGEERAERDRERPDNHGRRDPDKPRRVDPASRGAADLMGPVRS